MQESKDMGPSPHAKRDLEPDGAVQSMDFLPGVHTELPAWLT